MIDSGSRKHSIQVHGIRIEDHILASNLENQIIRGKVSDFAVDENGCLVGNRVAERLRLQLGDGVVVQAGAESRQFRVVGIFETESVRLIKKGFSFIIQPPSPFLEEAWDEPSSSCRFRNLMMLLIWLIKCS